MSDPDAKIRAALTHLLQRCRTVPSVPGWVDEAVEEIRAQIGAPSGVVTADTPEAAAAMVALKERAEALEAMTLGANEAEALIAEMLGSFTEGRNGWSSRVSAERIAGWTEGMRKAEAWRERLGEQ